MTAYHYHLTLRSETSRQAKPAYVVELADWPQLFEGEMICFPGGMPNLLTMECACPFKELYLAVQGLPSVEDPVPEWIKSASVWGIEGTSLHYAHLDYTYGYTVLSAVALDEGDLTLIH